MLYLQKPEVGNFQCLYGLHEKYLNNLASRFVEGLIPDLSRYSFILFLCVSPVTFYLVTFMNLGFVP